MTQGEQIAFNNGFILGMTTRGIIKGETIIKTYYDEPIINGGIVMADRPLVGNDAEIQNMIFNAKANVRAQTNPYFIIAYGKCSSTYPFATMQPPKWLVLYSSSNTKTFTKTSQHSYLATNPGDVVAVVNNDFSIGDGYYQNNVWDVNYQLLPYIVYSTVNIIDSVTGEVAMPAPYNLFG